MEFQIMIYLCLGVGKTALIERIAVYNYVNHMINNNTPQLGRKIHFRICFIRP